MNRKNQLLQRHMKKMLKSGKNRYVREIVDREGDEIV